MLNRNSYSFLILLSGFLLCVPQALPAQFLTIARKIKSMKSAGNEVATVILDAGAGKVYQALIDTLLSKPKFRITVKEDSKKHVEFSEEGSTLSMQVDSLDVKLSQITVLAVSSGNSPPGATDAATRAIMSVCDKVGIHCSLKEP